MTVGERIKKIRLEKGMTQKEVAEKCGLFDSAIRRYESGRQNPKLETIDKIAAALGVNGPDLLYDPEDNPFTELIKMKESLNSAIAPTNTIAESLRNMLPHINGDKIKQEALKNIREDVIEKYDSLNILGKEKAHDYITDLSEQEKYTKSDKTSNRKSNHPQQ